MWVFSRMVVAVVVGGMCVACSPQPSADTVALEPYLLTADEVGMEFTEQRGGAVSFSVGHLCPDTDVEIEGFGTVKAWFTKPGDGDDVEIEEHLYTGDPETVVALMCDLKTAFGDCDGIEWEHFGEPAMIRVVEGPAVGEDRIAVTRALPDDGGLDPGYTIYVLQGDVIVIVDVPEHSDAYDAVVAKALDKLPT